jgi:hypothetical protein
VGFLSFDTGTTALPHIGRHSREGVFNEVRTTTRLADR